MLPIRFAFIAFAMASAPVAWAQAVPTAPPAPAETGAPQPSLALTGSEGWKALLGNTISGRTPDGPYKEFFKPDGSVVHVDKDGKDLGRWTMKDASVCFTYPDQDEEDCRNVQVEGTHGDFVDRDGSTYRFDIQPGNPEHF